MTVANRRYHSEPLTPIRHPPADNHDGNCGGERPPERQDEIGDQAKQGEYDPENFALHEFILRAVPSARGGQE